MQLIGGASDGDVLLASAFPLRLEPCGDSADKARRFRMGDGALELWRCRRGFLHKSALRGAATLGRRGTIPRLAFSRTCSWWPSATSMLLTTCCGGFCPSSARCPSPTREKPTAASRPTTPIAPNCTRQVQPGEALALIHQNSWLSLRYEASFLESPSLG